jgi:diguanylate cyclase (GGDEF)-like protein/putative nucleotidyltransferase with HDIG domain
MASVTLMLDALWERSPILAASLLGPMVAIGLYQRSMHKALQAMRLALTDPLTGLGNHRHFHERLQAELESALAQGTELAVCLLDLDNFKQINDRYGHPAGDRLLTQMAECLRPSGDAFRLGGDEFALIFPGKGEEEAQRVAEDAIARLAGHPFEHGGTVSFSAGVAAAPEHARDRAELVRLADIALYWAKAEGKNRCRVYEADSPSFVELKHFADGRSREARLLAAGSLARAVDARDAYVGSHSERVGDLAAAIAAQLGCDADEVELVRLAGRLHDLGKLAVPEEILRKTDELTRAERTVLKRHAQIGYQMLESLGVDPIGSWVLHHHERYDGDGYPDGLAGDDIPLGARILLVADAYDAMTSERAYSRSVGHEAALAEILRCSGTQFDPAVVEAFTAIAAGWRESSAA